MKVEIWSDVVCPWCYLGKRRFEEALAAFEHRDDVDVVWRSFELDPQAEHPEDESLSDMLSKKFGLNSAQIDAMHEQMTALAAEQGLDYHLDLAKPSNTFDAHRLIHLAAREGLAGAMTERLMRAYFTEGLPIGDRDTLVNLGAGVGLDAGEVREVLETDRYAAEVRADEQRASLFGIQGVPFFAIDEKYGISGAQSVAYISAALAEAWQSGYAGSETTRESNDAASEGDACVPAAQRG